MTSFLSAAVSLIERVVPDAAASILEKVAACSGLRWGPTPPNTFWFQSPKIHLFLFVAVPVGYCGTLMYLSRGHHREAVQQLQVKTAGRSTRSWVNRAISSTLLVCFASQIYTKSIRPQPLIQLGWLLMPCHLITLGWIAVFIRSSPEHYAESCYLATLLTDWSWGPIMAAAQPDWSDHQYPFEGYIFVIHHGLLLLLPWYFAARYDVLKMNWKHLGQLTWIPTMINFGFYTPYSILSGLNLNYMLYPPPVKGLPAFLNQPLYRPVVAVILVPLSVVSNTVYQGLGKLTRGLISGLKGITRKLRA